MSTLDEPKNVVGYTYHYSNDTKKIFTERESVNCNPLYAEPTEPLEAILEFNEQDYQETPPIEVITRFKTVVTSYASFHNQPIQQIEQLLGSDTIKVGPSENGIDKVRDLSIGPSSLFYVQVKQRQDYIKIFFPNVRREAIVSVDSATRMLRIDGVYFKLCGPILPLEWCSQNISIACRYGVRRLSPKGVCIFLPKAAPTYWEGAIYGCNYRDKQKPIWVHFLLFPVSDDEASLMQKFVESTTQTIKNWFSKLSSAPRIIHVGCDIIAKEEHVDKVIEDRLKQPVDILGFVGHGTGQVIQMWSDYEIDEEKVIEMVDTANSVVDENTVNNIPNAWWHVNGVKLVLFYNCFNGQLNGLADQVKNKYPVPTISFAKPLSQSDLTTSHGYTPWFTSLIIGYMFGDPDVMNAIHQTKSIHSEMSTLSAIDMIAANINVTQSTKLISSPLSTLTSKYEPVLKNHNGANDERWISYEDIREMNPTKLWKLVQKGSFSEFWKFFEKEKARMSKARDRRRNDESQSSLNSLDMTVEPTFMLGRRGLSKATEVAKTALGAWSTVKVAQTVKDGIATVAETIQRRDTEVTVSTSTVTTVIKSKGTCENVDSVSQAVRSVLRELSTESTSPPSHSTVKESKLEDTAHTNK